MRTIGFEVYRYDELPEAVRQVVLEAYREECERELNTALHDAVVPRIAEAAGKLGIKLAERHHDGKAGPDVFWGYTNTGSRRVFLRGTWEATRRFASKIDVSAGLNDEALHQVVEFLGKAALEDPGAGWRNTVFAAGKDRIECNSDLAQRAMKKFVTWCDGQFRAEWERITGREFLESYLGQRLRTAEVEFTAGGERYQQDAHHRAVVVASDAQALLTEVCAETARAIRYARGDLGGSYDDAVTIVARRVGGVFVQRGLALDERFLEATGQGLREKIDATLRHNAGLPPARTREQVDVGLCDPSPAVREAIVRAEELTQVQVYTALLDESAEVRRAVVERHGQGMTKHQMALALTDDALNVRLAASSVNWESYRLDEAVARALRPEAMEEALRAGRALRAGLPAIAAGTALEEAEEAEPEQGQSH